MAASLSLYRDKEIDFAENVKFLDSGRAGHLARIRYEVAAHYCLVN
jgi:hypothetical protein